jgi:uncharacterized repeat protein (TIGR03803 family)
MHYKWAQKRLMKTGLARILMVAAGAAFLMAPAAQAGVIFKSLFSLTGNTYATLVQSSNGTYLYGTTVGTGLLESYGTVFAVPTNGNTSLEPPAPTNLLLFTASDGGAPHAGVILGPQGYLYGTTSSFAISNTLFSNGMGSVFSLRTNGTFTRLYRFGTVTNSKGQPLDGASPRAPLANGPGNVLYGTTFYGGSNGYLQATPGYGTVFKITTNGVLTGLHSFLGSDGANPTGLTLGHDTNFYGAASYGGSNTTVVDINGDVGFGAIFKITTNGLTTTLYSFGTVTNAAGDALDGAQPNALIQGNDGNFYGTTAFGGSNTTVVDSSGDVGCGTVFKFSANGTLTTLYSFGSVTNSKGTPLDGANPAGPLAQGPDGNFYGVTEYGGETNTGTIFVITPAGTLTTLYILGHTNNPFGNLQTSPPGNGNYPHGGLMLAADDNLYGTTYDGGPDEDSKGSVFRFGPGVPDFLAAPASVTIVAGATNSFVAEVDSLYAMSYQWQFDGTNLSDGGQFSGSAITNLALTGAALTNTGTYTIIASNAAGTAKTSAVLTVVPALISKQPAGATIVAGASNTFTVGVTSVYPVSCQWQFDGTNLSDGGGFSGSSTSNLTLSGAAVSNSGTYSVVVSNAVGSVHSAGAVLVVEPFITLTAPASLTVIAGSTATFSVEVQNVGPLSYQWQFDGANISNGGNIFGSSTSTLTITNAVTNDSGTYSVTASNASGSETWTALLAVIPQAAAGYSMTNLHSFIYDSEGGQPNGLMLGRDGALYGTTTYGGPSAVLEGGAGYGTFFRLFPGGTLTNLYSFTGGSDEADPNSTLVQASNGFFYGTTWSEVYQQYGTVFEASTNGTLATLVYFDQTNGSYPNAVTLGRDGNLYGTTYEGGANNAGTVFEVNSATGALDTLISSGAVTTGNYPAAGLTLGLDGNFYGTAAQSGDLFEIATNGTLENVYYFPGGDFGMNPLGVLLQTSDGSFYGTTSEGGATGNGTVFKFTPGGGFTTLYSFGSVTNFDGSLLDGVRPIAGLVMGLDGSLYGATYSGGYSNCGTVFKITTNGALATVAWLDGANGSGPAAALALGTNGNLYGTTQSGGADNAGVIFQLALVPPAPRIQSISTAGGMINLAWSVTAGQTYQAQFTVNLSQGQWQALAGPTVAAGAVLNVEDALNQSQCFYRLVQLPAP